MAKVETKRSATIDRRPVVTGDEDLLYEIYASTRKQEMLLVDWSSEQKEAFLRSQLKAQKTEYDARFPGATHDIILVDGKPAGQIWIGRCAEEIRLLDIALLPQHRRRGVGTVLVTELQQEAARTAKPLRHCVRIDNQPALAFYERLGFTITAERGMYYTMEWGEQAPRS